VKRSEINRVIREGRAFMDSLGWAFPPFADWTPEDWKQKGHEADEIREHALGWDVTDLAGGNFRKLGLLLFTVRNGLYGKPGKTYAEKIMVSQEEQLCPVHFHWNKMEDIINRGGGNLVIQLQRADPRDEGKLSPDPVRVQCDGVTREVPAGGRLVLTPGESITLEPYMYHSFWAEKGKGPVMIGEVSMVNDDNTDNRFYEPLGRFPAIDEDEPPYRLLCNEYPPAPETSA